MAHYRQASTLLRRTRELERLWNSLEIEVRRRGLPERTLLALADAASGLRVRNATYRPVAEVSDHLASRDLKLLVEQGLLVPNLESVADDVASETLLGIRGEIREPRRVEDPFADATDTART